MTNEQGERLAKRVAALQQCSRAEAERLIERGCVKVDGVIADDPARRVGNEAIAVEAAGLGETIAPVTLLWHKPAGIKLEAGRPLAGLIESVDGLSPWQFRQLRCCSALPAAGSGLAVFAQSPGVQRKLREDAPLLEQEWLLDFEREVPDAMIAALGEQSVRLASGPRAPFVRISIGSRGSGRTRLRLALKGADAGLLPAWLESAGLRPAALYLQRLGRVALGKLDSGAWRLLGPHERF